MAAKQPVPQVAALSWIRVRRRLLIAIALAVVLVAAVALVVAYHRVRHHRVKTVTGSTSTEFVTTAPPPPKKPPEPGVYWPTYGYDQERARFDPGPKLRPPFRRVWTFHGRSLLEFPPVVGYGRVFITTFHGALYALSAETGKKVWRYKSPRCGWASPALDAHLVFETWIGNYECGSKLGDGEVAAFDEKTGKLRWRRLVGPTESSPLVARHLVLLGDWNGRVWALDERTGKTRWTTDLNGAIKGSVALSGRRLYIGTYGGEVACIDVRNGHVLWTSTGHGSFYSSPAVAYGRVYIGSLNGGVYAFGASTGDLLWEQPTGGYVYASPAIWHRLVLIGSYDGSFYAFDAGTGSVRWRFPAGGEISGSASVVSGIVYFSTFTERTFGLNAANGRVVKEWPDGKYSPVVADASHLYLVGLGRLYALAKPHAPPPRRHRAARRACARCSKRAGRTAAHARRVVRRAKLHGR